MKPFILVRDLVKDYDGRVRALDRVDLEIRPGEWVAVMGASGSGKTTLLNLIAGLDRPTAGTLWVDGADLPSLSEEERARFRREKVGLIFQQFHLIPYLTAVENVMLAQHFHSMADRGEAGEALRRVGLGERTGHLPSRLSGGEQQRVCIARALINRPGLILADEPTGNLDAENEEGVLEIFRGLHEAGHTLLIVTHNLRIGFRADRIVQLAHGRVVSDEWTHPRPEGPVCGERASAAAAPPGG
ncbi:MAG: ABC transporter ATP-binding protein [Candidatus Tectomicrobia bacterium]|nr:ABC transporter ATP-binding protein [Candidatus Tectomicrobia bacterium]